MVAQGEIKMLFYYQKATQSNTNQPMLNLYLLITCFLIHCFIVTTEVYSYYSSDNLVIETKDSNTCIFPKFKDFDQTKQYVPINSLNDMGSLNDFRSMDTISRYLQKAVQDIYEKSNHTLGLSKNTEKNIATVEILPSGIVALYTCTDSIRCFHLGSIRPQTTQLPFFKKISNDFSCLVTFYYEIIDFTVKISKIINFEYINTPRSNSLIYLDFFPAACDIKHRFFNEVDSDCKDLAAIDLNIHSDGTVQVTNVFLVKQKNPDMLKLKKLTEICQDYFKSHRFTPIKRPFELTKFSGLLFLFDTTTNSK